MRNPVSLDLPKTKYAKEASMCIFSHKWIEHDDDDSCKYCLHCYEHVRHNYVVKSSRFVPREEVGRKDGGGYAQYTWVEYECTKCGHTMSRRENYHRINDSGYRGG